MNSSADEDILQHNQNFVIDGQQRLRTFYIDLLGSFEGKSLFFDLFSNSKVHFDFRFARDIKSPDEKIKSSSTKSIVQRYQAQNRKD